MTREEAIEVIRQDIPCEHDADLIEALTMAIQALEQPEIIRCKDCDEWHRGEGHSVSCEGLCCDWRVLTGEDFYCGDAVKR